MSLAQNPKKLKGEKNEESPHENSTPKLETQQTFQRKKKSSSSSSSNLNESPATKQLKGKSHNKIEGNVPTLIIK